jgi:hypothetical protein
MLRIGKKIGFLGAFAELRKVTISFMSVIPHAATALLPLDALS